MLGLTIGLPLFGACVITMHAFALYLLRKTPRLRSNHRLYLYHISLLEISLTIVSLGTLFLNILTKKDKKMQDYGFICVGIFAMPWTLVLMAFTLDRFLQVYLSLKYRTYVTERRQKIVVAFCYLIGVFELGVVILVKNVCEGLGSYIKLIRCFLYQGNTPVLLAVCMIVYSYIFYQRRNSRRRTPAMSWTRKNPKLSPTANPANQPSALRRVVFVPFIIVLSFFGLAVVPCLVFLHSSNIQKWKYIDHVWRLLWYAEFFTQVFVYALMDVDIRNKLMRLIRLDQQRDTAHSSRRRIQPTSTSTSTSL